MDTATEPTQPLAASAGGIANQEPIPELLTPGRALGTMRENPELSFTANNQQRYRCCPNNPVRGWAADCDPDTGEATVHEGKCSATCYDLSEFAPFTITAVEEHNCLGGPIDIQSDADRWVDAWTEWAVTTELDSAPWSKNDSFRTVGLDITPNDGTNPTPVSPTQALAMLLSYYRNRTAGLFVVHAPPEALPALAQRWQTVNRGGVLTLPGGSILNIGTGFSGVAPDLDANGNPKATAPDPTEPMSGVVTLYATRSMPEYRLGPIRSAGDVFGTENETILVPRLNGEVAESIRQSAVRFDPACVIGIQVTLRESNC